MSRIVLALVALVAASSLADATLTAPLQDDPGGDGDASDDPSAPSRIDGPPFRRFEAPATLVPLDDPEDHYVVHLADGAGSAFAFAVTPAPLLDVRIAVQDALGRVHAADEAGLGGTEVVLVPDGVPGDHVLSVVLVPPCRMDPTNSTCPPDGAALALASAASTYRLVVGCEPHCP